MVATESGELSSGPATAPVGTISADAAADAAADADAWRNGEIFAAFGIYPS